MKNRALFLAATLAAAMSNEKGLLGFGDPMDDLIPRKTSVIHKAKSQLTKKQMKRRKASKAAKIARRNNR